MNRGEVWWEEDPVRGRRPHLILSRSSVIPVIDKVLAAPATRVVRGIPSEVALDQDDGMPVACVLSLDNVTVVRKAHLVEKITVLSPDRMDEVCRAIRFAIDC